MGIEANLHNWKKSFILSWRKVVTILEQDLTPNAMLSGVLQGSVLGFLLFVVYINEIDVNLKHITVSKYVDDFKLYLELKRMYPIDFFSAIWPGHTVVTGLLAANECTIIHFERKTMEFDSFPTPALERLLGIIIVNNDLCWMNYISIIIVKIKCIFVLLIKSFVSHLSDTISLKLSMACPEYQFAGSCPETCSQTNILCK